MNKPSTVALDANACIIHSLNLDIDHSIRIQHCDCKYVRSLVTSCRGEAIEVGTFGTAKDECNRNITGAAVELARKIGVLYDNYVALKVRRISMDHLRELFSMITEFEERHTPEEIQAARQFFKDCRIPSRSKSKDNIPGDDDLILFVSSHNLRPEITHFVSEDPHFVDYAKKIEESAYRVRVMPIQDLAQILKELNWPVVSNFTDT